MYFNEVQDGIENYKDKVLKKIEDEQHFSNFPDCMHET